MKFARTVLAVAVTVLATATTAAPQMLPALSPWQRIVIPPVKAPMAEQCVVVDADLYAHAAPGLRDVRLVQDGQELPYAMDVSFDTRVGDAAPPPPDDRALYEVVQVIPLEQGALPEQPGAWFGEALVSAHVPVERIRLEPAPQNPVQLQLNAAARMNLRDAEELKSVLDREHPAANFTLGANLQDEADVRILLHGVGQGTAQRVVLEMRRREICYRPRSLSPVHLLLGNVEQEPPRYDYALHFQPSAEPLMAAMGPMTRNPAYQAPQVSAASMHITAGLRTAVMLIIVLGSLAVTAFAIVELRRR